MGRATTFFCPGRGQKSLNFNNKINFKGFYTKFFVFLQIKDMKHIECDFCSNGWVMSQRGGTWGARGAQGVKILFFPTWSCGISN